MISLLVALAVASVAEDAPAAAPTPVPVRKICKVLEATSSRLGAKRVCRTEAEWKEGEKATTRDLESRQRQ